MNKSHIINYVAAHTNLTKTASGKALEAMLTAISQGLREDGNVRILGFGGFDVKDTKERPGRNPKTGAVITIKAGKKITFTPSDNLKEKM